MKLPICLLVAATLVVSTFPMAASADTTLTGPHDGNTSGDNNGYDTTAGVYTVPANSGLTPSATFNSNSSVGLFANEGTFTSLNISGGQFDNNGNGVQISHSFNATSPSGTTVTISSGEFTHNGNAGVVIDNFDGDYSINGGSFGGNGVDVVTEENDGSIYGGTFSSGLNFQLLASAINLYGSFVGVPPGSTETLHGSPSPDPYNPYNIGSFFGTLQDDVVPQSFTFEEVQGAIVLHGVLPEPASLGPLTVAGVAMLWRRARQLSWRGVDRLNASAPTIA